MVTWEEVTEGLELPEVIKAPITEVQLVRYAGASGDFNPLHTVNAVGVKAGYSGVIAHGMLIMGFAGQALGEWFPISAVQQFGVRFSAVTKPAETIIIKGRISRKDQENAVLELSAQNEFGELKLLGQANINQF